jgi:hypothetical protein
MSVPDIGAWRSQEQPVVEALLGHTSIDSSCIRHASEVLR